MLGQRAQSVLLMSAALCTSACKTPSEGAPANERTSPQAHLVPAPLGKPSSAAVATVPLASVPTGDSEMPGDETAAPAQAFALTVHFRAEGAVTFPAKLQGQIGGARMWLQPSEDGFSAPFEFELRARTDRIGHLLLWSDKRKYRAMPPGSLRPFFTDGSFDVAPVATAEGNDGLRKMPAGKFTVQKAKRAGLAEAGTLLCRMVSEFAQVAPGSVLCGADEYPSKVVYEWDGDARESMTLTIELGAKPEVAAPDAWQVPPAMARWSSRPASALSAPALFKGASEKLSAGGETGALTVSNRTNLPRMVWLDATPVAWLSAGESLLLDAVRKGNYVLDCRSFWGDEKLPTANAKVPGKVSCGDLPLR